MITAFSLDSEFCWQLVLSDNSDGGIIMVTMVSHFVSSTVDRAVFHRVSKVIINCFGFALISSVIGLENSKHSLSTKQKQT